MSIDNTTALLRRFWRRIFPPCTHKWRDLYGDEIMQFDARSLCERCSKRAPFLMEKGQTDE